MSDFGCLWTEILEHYDTSRVMKTCEMGNLHWLPCALHCSGHYFIFQLWTHDYFICFALNCQLHFYIFREKGKGSCVYSSAYSIGNPIIYSFSVLGIGSTALHMRDEHASPIYVSSPLFYS